MFIRVLLKLKFYRRSLYNLVNEAGALVVGDGENGRNPCRLETGDGLKSKKQYLCIKTIFYEFLNKLLL